MTDVFRVNARPASPQEVQIISRIKGYAQTLYDELDNVQPRNSDAWRALALAKTNLEQAVMWAIKGLTV